MFIDIGKIVRGD